MGHRVYSEGHGDIVSRLIIRIIGGYDMAYRCY